MRCTRKEVPSAELLARPDVALAAVTAQLAGKLLQDRFRGYGYGADVLTVSASETHEGLCREAEDMADSAGWKLVDEQRDAWIERLPDQPEGVFAWLLQQDHTMVLQLLTFLVASSVGGVSGAARDEQSTDALALALGLNMSKWWKPTAAAYLNHVSKARIVDVVTQGVSAGAASPLAAMKKDAAVAAAELALGGTDWLPECLRARREGPAADAVSDKPGGTPEDDEAQASDQDVLEGSALPA